LLGVRSKSWSTPAGAHMFFSIPYFVLPADPCTISTQVMRVLGFAVCAVTAVGIAGIIDSRKGSATAAPAPRSTVRREMCFLVMNILMLLIPYNQLLSARLIWNAVLLAIPRMYDEKRLLFFAASRPIERINGMS